MSKVENNEAFVRDFQTRFGLKSDGWAGPATRAKLGEIKPASIPTGQPNGPVMDTRSEERLKGVDARLVGVVRRARELSGVPFIVIEGLRTKERQADLYAQGRTKSGPKVTWTLNSKHIEGKAVDLGPTLPNGQIDWNDLSKFDAIARAMRQAAAERNVAVRWGADWDSDGRPREKGETDSPHFEVS